MLVDVRDLKTGDLFVFNHTWKPGVAGTYHFRFIKRTYSSLSTINFMAVLEKIVHEDMPIYRDCLSQGFVETFGVSISSTGHWPRWEVLEEGKKGVDHCDRCAIPLEWASLAQRCPKCWKVF